MIGEKTIILPRVVVIGKNVSGKVAGILDKLKLGRHVITVSDNITYKILGEKIEHLLIEDGFHVRSFHIAKADLSTVEELYKFVEKELILLAIGGGSVIDVCKAAAKLVKIKFISIPTAASHDGIASSRASIWKKNLKHSIEAEPPVAIIADTEIIKKAPEKLFRAGCGDVLSNYTAVLDWKLAHRKYGEYYGDYAANLSLLSAQMIMKNAESLRIIDEAAVRILLEALISSSVAMSIAGSSRPCSGGEHLFSHALDMIHPGAALHGEQCGIGAILCAYLHGADWKSIKKTLEIIGAPTRAKDINIENKYIIDALIRARCVRDRYTILSEISEKTAIEAAKSTGVIE